VPLGTHPRGILPFLIIPLVVRNRGRYGIYSHQG
jgi:hypothetical protein